MADEQKMPSRWDTVEFLGEEERRVLDEADVDTNAVVTSTEIKSKLGLFSTSCMIINRMIGTGIFSTPATILKATDSPGATLLLWAFGFLIAWSGLMVYIEFGLSVPRYTIHGVKTPVPRSGGEKNYLEYVFKAPKYFTTCVYGVTFIVLGNTAGNAIAFAEYVLRANGYSKDDLDKPTNHTSWVIKGVAISAITGACLLHGSWRAGGIYINNFFATVKTLLLMVVIGVGLAYSGGVRPNVDGHELAPSPQNLAPEEAFRSTIDGGVGGGMYAYSQSLMLVIFAYGGFENANFILSEVDQPAKTYKRASMISLVLVSVLYMLTNIVYLLVLDRKTFKDQGSQLALKFFENIFTPQAINKAAAAFVAFSSFGNIVVVTFVASRVKQEIAKEGVLPWSLIIAQDMRTPFSYLRSKFRGTNAPSIDSEGTPIAALTLHWLFSFILVISPKVNDTYLVLLLLHSYALHIWVGFFLSAGLLWLYFKRGSTWTEKSCFNPLGRFNWIWAAIFAVVNLFLMIVAWIPPPEVFRDLVLKYTPVLTYPIVAVSLMAFGVVYWVGFAKLYPAWYHRELVVNRYPIMCENVQIHEAVFFNWTIRTGTGGVELGEIGQPL